MSSHEGWSHGSLACGGKRLVAGLFDTEPTYLESLSWSLGDHLTTSDGATTLFSLEHRRSNRSVTVFEATDHTCLVRLRTPSGREKFFGAAKSDVLEASTPADWIRPE